jgi:hypothetical protein
LLNASSRRRLIPGGHVEELIEHVDDCRRPARRHSLPGAPGVDPLDQPGLDSDVNICGFLFHTIEVGRYRAPRLIIPAKKLIDATGLAARGGDGKCLSW